MFNSNPLGPNFNEGMIDRLLGKAYLTVKEVHDNLPDIVKAIAVSEDSKELTASVDKLAEILKDFDTNAGMFLGHDLGEVGEPANSNTIIGDNFLSEFTKSSAQIKTVGDNIDVVNRLVAHINELKAIAEALTSLLAVKDALPEITKSNEQLADIKIVANSISDVHSVKECLSEIITLAENINYFPEIINSADDISKVAKYINSLIICAGNIATYIEANERLKTAQEVIANDNIATVANNVEVVKAVAAKMSDIDTLNQLDPRITSLEETKANHEERITANETQLANHELRLDNMEDNSDIGQFSVRVQAIEDKNLEQDGRLSEHDTKLSEHDTKLSEHDTKLFEHEASISQEVEDRTNADTELDTKISQEVEDRTNADAELDTKIATNKADLTQLIEDNKLATDTSIANLSNDLQTNYVDKANAQEISGLKTFSNNICFKNNDVDVLNDDTSDKSDTSDTDVLNDGTDSTDSTDDIDGTDDIDDTSNNKSLSIRAYDKNDLLCNYVNFSQQMKSSDTEHKRIVCSSLGVRLNKTAEEYQDASINLKAYLNSDDTASYCGYAPTPADSAKSNEIITAKWAINHCDYIFPNYAQGIEIPLKTVYTFPCNGWIFAIPTTIVSQAKGYYDDMIFFWVSGANGSWGDCNSICFPVYKGHTTHLDGSACLLYFYPCYYTTV